MAFNQGQQADKIVSYGLCKRRNNLDNIMLDCAIVTFLPAATVKA